MGFFTYALIIAALLILPFFFDGLDGVHRWISVGSIKLYIASIVLPLLMIHIWKLALNKREHDVTALTVVTSGILLFQPDAGQLTAFACAIAFIVWKMIDNRMIKAIVIAFTAAACVISWIFLDDLAPVPYVEHILFLVAGLGNFWFILGVFSLMLLLLPFFFMAGKASFRLGFTI